MIVSIHGSISEQIANANEDPMNLLQHLLQEKQDELLAWANQWHAVDIHALVFIMETTLTLLRSRMDPLDEILLEGLRSEFGAVAGAVPVPIKEDDDEA